MSGPLPPELPEGVSDGLGSSGGGHLDVIDDLFALVLADKIHSSREGGIDLSDEDCSLVKNRKRLYINSHVVCLK